MSAIGIDSTPPQATVPFESQKHRVGHIRMKDGSEYDVHVVFRDDFGNIVNIEDFDESSCFIQGQAQKKLEAQLKLMAESCIGDKTFSDVHNIQINHGGVTFNPFSESVKVHNLDCPVAEELSSQYSKAFGSKYEQMRQAWVDAEKTLVKDFEHHMDHINKPYAQGSLDLNFGRAKPDALLGKTKPGDDPGSFKPSPPEGSKPSADSHGKPSTGGYDMDTIRKHMGLGPKAEPSAPPPETDDDRREAFEDAFGGPSGYTKNWLSQFRGAPIDTGTEVPSGIASDFKEETSRWLEADFAESSDSSLFKAFNKKYDQQAPEVKRFYGEDAEDFGAEVGKRFHLYDELQDFNTMLDDLTMASLETPGKIHFVMEAFKEAKEAVKHLRLDISGAQKEVKLAEYRAKLLQAIDRKFEEVLKAYIVSEAKKAQAAGVRLSQASVMALRNKAFNMNLISSKEALSIYKITSAISEKATVSEYFC